MVFKQETYHLSKIIFIFLTVLCFSGCGKKPPLLPPGPPPEMEKPMQLDAKVMGYKTTPDGNIDRMTVSQGKQRVTIHFPPHLAKHILEIAEINAVVHLKTHMTNRGYELVSVASENGKDAFDTGRILPPRPRPGKEIRITGTVSRLIGNGKNGITGFVVGKKTVMLHPEESRVLVPLLKKAGQVEVTALERNTEDGTVNTLPFPPVVMTEIKIDSIVYKIR